MKRQTLNNFKLIVSSMLIFVIMFAFALSNNVLLSPNTTAYAESSENIIDTNFMFSPTSAVTIGDTTLVLDTNQNYILKFKDNKIMQGEDSITSAYNATHMFSLGKYIILLSITSPEDSLRFLDAETFEEVIIAESLDSQSFSSYTNLSSYKQNNSLHILLYTLGINSGLEDMLYFTVSLNNDIITVSEPRNLTIDTARIEYNFESNIKTLSIVYNDSANVISCLVHTNTDFFSFKIDSIVESEQSNKIDSVSGCDITIEDFANLKNIYIQSHENNSYLLLAKNNEVSYAPITTPNATSDKFSLASEIKTLQTTISSISSMEINENQLVICSKDEQKVGLSLVTSDSSNITLNSVNYLVNPSIKTTLYDNNQVKLMEITSDTSIKLLFSPYSTSSIITLSPETKVVEIGYGEIYYGEYESQNATHVNGYNYYLATINGDNYYGYLPVSAVTELEEKESSVPYAYTKKNVNIYKYPSNTIDQNNTIIATLSETTKVEIISDISEFRYLVGTNASTRMFYFVRYNNQVGYIVSTDIDKFPEVVLVQTNATITRGVSVYENLTDKLPTWTLSEGARVRILENRFGNEKYTKIAFNDDDGVTCTGYILADNIQADSWTTMQIIGFVLVLLSIFLLVIILIVRSRVNHE